MSAPHFREILALSLVKKMGPVGYKHLMEKFGNAADALSMDSIELSNLPKKILMDRSDFKKKELLARADDEIAKAARLGVDILVNTDERYPQTLREIYDPPIVLYVKGKLPAAQIPAVAVVGSRVASIYGRKMSAEISRDMAAVGVVVVSGLALGVDTAAHEGALEADGVTLAVLGGGIGRLYPPQNRKLADKICQKGALISEYPVEMEAQSGFFPVRNRIISGLSAAVLVVEAKERSGALITADAALEQGREVFALPGNADSSKSMGTNSLLKQGARLALSAQDILSELGLLTVKKKKAEDRAAMTAEEKRLFSLLESGPVQIEEIIESTGMSLQKTLTVLSYLEMKKLVKESPGKYFQKA